MNTRLERDRGESGDPPLGSIGGQGCSDFLTTMMSGARSLGDSERCLVVAGQRRRPDLDEFLTGELDKPWGRAVSKPACHRDPSVVRNTPYYSISSLLYVARRVSCVGSLVGPVRVRQQWHRGGASSPPVRVGGGSEGGVVITVNR